MAAKAASRKNTKSSRAKNTAKKISALPSKNSLALPSSFSITKRSAALLWQNKLLLGLITLIHILLYLFFVQGLSGVADIKAIRDQFSNKFAGGVSAYLQLISGSSSTGVTQSAQLYQVVILVIVSLATVWALRQIIGGATLRTRDTFYKGMYPLIPFMLVLLVIMIEFVPSLVGLTIYQLLVVTGISGGGLGQLVWALVALALTLLSLWLVTSSIFAAVIVTLPDMTPLSALRSASKLVRGRRWKVLRKMLFLPLLLFAVSAIIMLPIIIIAPYIAQWIFVIFGTAALTASITYLYVMYRDLLNE